MLGGQRHLTCETPVSTVPLSGHICVTGTGSFFIFYCGHCITDMSLVTSVLLGLHLLLFLFWALYYRHKSGHICVTGIGSFPLWALYYRHESGHICVTGTASFLYFIVGTVWSHLCYWDCVFF